VLWLIKQLWPPNASASGVEAGNFWAESSVTNF